MIVPLVITAGVLAISLWLCTMYVWWQQETGKTAKPATALAIESVTYCTRLARRGWYACAMYARSIGQWSNRKMQKVFFALFPGAEPAFAKRDTLAGLKHGPSSYFLQTISEKEPAAETKKTAHKFS